MKKSFILSLALIFILICCGEKDQSKTKNETMLEGETTMLVDETLKPIIEDQIQIFHDRYDARININAKSESEVIQALINDSAQIAILSRSLTEKEINFFKNKKIVPKIKPIANDAIVLISKKNTIDTLITLDKLVNLVKGLPSSEYKGIVFDNPNSSTVRYLLDLSKSNELPKERVFSFKTNDEVIKYVAENEGIIGVVGLNHIYNPSVNIQEYINKINVLSVKSNQNNNYYSPTQNNLAEGNYPLARELYIVNCQGFPGIGMGFTSFVSSDVGQRIILKSGLVPLNFPPRKIIINQKK
ncbi:MAG TPA: substrate-binding domain-containing protein [Flavobacterium sp.]|nr:substrate-binding domain-containing protein [Flavobacterium sp.]